MVNTMPTDYRTFTPRDQARWDAKVEPAPGGCVLWTAKTNARGYGVFRLGKRVLLAHRVSYVQANGQIPDGMQVCHQCDTAACVNPQHLLLGSAADNAQDKIKRGRAKGINAAGANGRAKLDWDKVDEIRARLKTGESQRKLAAEFGVTQAQVSEIQLGRTWKKPGVPVIPKTPRSDRGKNAKKTHPSVIRPTAADEARFWEKVDRGSAVDQLAELEAKRQPCWPWIATSKTRGGYGAFYIQGRRIPAHRMSYLLAHGEIPDADIAHSCANNLCVNPAHLEATDRTANMKNAETRARISKKNKGNRSRAVLTDVEIRYVKERFRDEPLLSARQLADDLENIVTPACLANIRKGKTGGHVVVEGFIPRRVTPKQTAAMRS
jgi:hypothetical protein